MNCAISGTNPTAHTVQDAPDPADYLRERLIVCDPVLQKYPQPGEVYESALYPGQRCRVETVLEAMVTFTWLGQYAYVPSQSVPVNRFIKDFTLLEDVTATD